MSRRSSGLGEGLLSGFLALVILGAALIPSVILAQPPRPEEEREPLAAPQVQTPRDTTLERIALEAELQVKSGGGLQTDSIVSRYGRQYLTPDEARDAYLEAFKSHLEARKDSTLDDIAEAGRDFGLPVGAAGAAFFGVLYASRRAYRDATRNMLYGFALSDETLTAIATARATIGDEGYASDPNILPWSSFWSNLETPRVRLLVQWKPGASESWESVKTRTLSATSDLSRADLKVLDRLLLSLLDPPEDIPPKA